jgi:FkbM family methyltransferase
MLRQLDKPEYLFNPRQVLKRISFAMRETAQTPERVKLPWGAQLTVNPQDAIGVSCCTMGIYDLPVTEALFRLIDAGETCVDVGANFGHMTAAMAHCSGPAGLVIGFEPYAPVFEELVANLGAAPNVRLERLAASSFEGTASLSFPDEFASNHGTATLCGAADGKEVVKTVRLEEYLAGRTIGVMKIDVEGHEFDVLAGCGGMLKGMIRDIIFEEHRAYPAETHRLLERANYRLYRIERSVLRPLLLPRDSSALHSNVSPNFLATTDPERAEKRFARLGWLALKRKKKSSAPVREKFDR